MSDRVWLITGCATGFGAALAQLLLDRGERVVASDKNLSALDHLKASNPEQLLSVQLDVTSDNNIRDSITKTMAHFGRIDILVNNAGLGWGGPFEEMPLAHNRLLFEVNILGMMALTQAVLPIMRAQGGGHIINISSDSGIYGQPFSTAYCATKHAVEGFSESLSYEVMFFGIKVTVIEPCGMFATAMPTDAIAEVEKTVQPNSPYYTLIAAALTGTKTSLQNANPPEMVAHAIIEIANMPHPPLRHAVGQPDRTRLLELRRQMPDEAFIQLIRDNLGK